MSGIFLATGYTCLLLLLMRRIRFYNAVPGLRWEHISYLFILKIIAGVGLWWIYTYVYTDRLNADIYKYFDDSAVMFSALSEKPMDFVRMLFGFRNDSEYFSETYYRKMNNWFRQYESNVYNDSHTVIRFNAAVRLISFGEYHVHTVVAAFLSLTGMVGLYRAFVKLLPGRERLLMFVIFLLPSVLFWASGAIKESLLFFGLGIMLVQVFRLLEGRIAASGIIALAFSSLFLFYLKFYVLMCMFPALLLYAWTRARPARWIPARALIIYGGAIILVLNLHYIVPHIDVLTMIATKQKDFIGLAEDVASGSYIRPPILHPDAWSFIVNAPYALYITFFGPMIHFSGAFGIISAIENAVLIGMLLLFLVYARPWRSVDRAMVVSMLGYVILLALIVGWTTPVMGALVRYRTPFLPFLMIIGLLIFDHHRFLSRWPGTKRFISA